jgi:uncharacterized protein YggE
MTTPIRSILLPAVACAALACAPAVAGDEPDADAKNLSTLTVRGQAELHKPADQLQMQVGVVTEAQEPTEALDRNSEHMQDVIKALQRVGLTKDEYETGRFGVRPLYERRPRNAGVDWQPRITGYEVSNSLLIRTKKLDSAGKLIEAANKAGANSIDSITFDLADGRTHRAEAISEAARNARADAKTLADAAGVRLVRVVSVSLDDAGWHPPVAKMGRAMAVAEAGAAPPISPGDVTVRAGVTIVYEIRTAEE